MSGAANVDLKSHGTCCRAQKGISMRHAAKRIATILSAVALSIVPVTIAHAAGSERAATRELGVELPPYETWISDVTPVASEASAFVDARLAERPVKPAIVLDIDNTALETTYHGDWYGTVPATPPILALALGAKANGAAIFFVTGRDFNYGIMTWRNLMAVGYPMDDIYFYHSETGLSLGEYKTGARTDIENKGFTIIANIGNNQTDIEGGHADRGFKLPDYDGLLV